MSLREWTREDSTSSEVAVQAEVRHHRAVQKPPPLSVCEIEPFDPAPSTAPGPVAVAVPPKPQPATTTSVPQQLEGGSQLDLSDLLMKQAADRLMQLQARGQLSPPPTRPTATTASTNSPALEIPLALSGAAMNGSGPLALATPGMALEKLQPDSAISTIPTALSTPTAGGAVLPPPGRPSLSPDRHRPPPIGGPPLSALLSRPPGPLTAEEVGPYIAIWLFTLTNQR